MTGDMDKITIPARKISPVDLIDEVVGEVRASYAVIDAEFTSLPMGSEAASVLWSAIKKLEHVRDFLNIQHGAS